MHCAPAALKTVRDVYVFTEHSQLIKRGGRQAKTKVCFMPFQGSEETNDMAAPTSPLDSLPVEILCCIFRYLDPITLIAFSQTSSHYRRVISPSKLNHVERLLALELLEEHGGMTTIFSPKHNIIKPNWRDPACDSMRWACTSCLRLLPHTAFGNHFLLGLGYRKPAPGSPAADPVSSWAPSRNARYWQSLKQSKQYKQRPEVVFEQKRLRWQYAGARVGNWWRGRRPRASSPPSPCSRGAGGDGPVREKVRVALRRIPAAPAPVPRVQLAARRDAAAGDAVRRRPWGHARGARGPQPATVFRERARPVLPRVFRAPGNGRPAGNAPVFTVHRRNATDFPFTLHMVRCPGGCARWQELRAFRVGWWWPRWSVGYRTRRGDFENWDGRALDGPAFFDGLVCNHCLAASGQTERLRSELLGFWLDCANHSLQQLAGDLRAGFMQLHYAVTNVSKKYACKRIIQKEILPGVVDPAFFREPPSRFAPGSRYFEPPLADLAFYRLRYGQWLDAFARIRDDEDMQEFYRLRAGFLETQQAILDEAYDVTEAHYVWLKKCKQEVLETPQVLVDWALARDGAGLA
ncbi:hypothetical protein PG994_000773 [Apiospora phragmitis]|uniref:F-box domain-containing protein n=1 Tax=Apiospora phragmitis TaxID=2905665 RepID=A0ABR1X762_9PEZI